MVRRACYTAIALGVPRLASACPVCFGASDGPMLRGSSMGILVLLAVTLAMLGAFGAFFLMLARRAARADRNGEMPRGWRQPQTEGGTPR